MIVLSYDVSEVACFLQAIGIAKQAVLIVPCAARRKVCTAEGWVR